MSVMDSNQDMHMVRHDAPLKQIVSFAVILEEAVLNDPGMKLIREKAVSVSGILVNGETFTESFLG